MTSFIAAVYDLRMNPLASTTDVAAIRAGFPSIDGDRVFLDNPGGTQVHRSVYDAVASYYRDQNANLGGPFVTSQASDAMLEDARSEAAAFLGAASSCRDRLRRQHDDAHACTPRGSSAAGSVPATRSS